MDLSQAHSEKCAHKWITKFNQNTVPADLIIQAYIVAAEVKVKQALLVLPRENASGVRRRVCFAE